MRIILVTGLGGAGRTTVAAATALAEARAGRRTLLISENADALFPEGNPEGFLAAGGDERLLAEAGTGGSPAKGTTGPLPEDGTTRPGHDGHPGDGPGPDGPGGHEHRPGGPGPDEHRPNAHRPDAHHPHRADSLGGPRSPSAPPGRLKLLRPRPADDFRREFLALQERSATVLDLLGAAPFEDAELTELPGSRQFALLRTLRDAAAGDHDLVVVDLPPLPEALAVLALPEQLRRYLRRLLPSERQAARALRPMLAQLAGVPMPAQWLYEATARWEAELAAVQDIVEAPGTTVRLVLEPGPAALRALRTARLGLALQGLALDTVVANRLLPAGSADPWLAGLADRQRRHLAELRAAAVEETVTELPHLGRDPHGPGDLALLAPAHPAPAPLPVPEWTVEDRRAEDGVLVWHIGLPGAVKGELSLIRRGDELLLGVGPFRRNLPLPAALRRCTVTGAGLVDGDLRVRFTPDPGLWPRTP
ncbi:MULTISPECIES: ArsA family ATPase [unclassified Streptomyces]|uniref:ArsA family ATPase n=1 Tax=unclassified Streptomyces TaxID=2593676 RepID=UPI0016614A6E|nr:MULTISPECIES: ArsA-related P-loop ATPase [unclassified Streptomyces]